MSLSTIDWMKSDDLDYGHNSSSGQPDMYNKANKALYALMGVEHSDSGAHKIADFLLSEQGSYAGNSTDDTDISLSDASMDIEFIIIAARAAQYPVFRSADMTSTNSKEVATNAFQTHIKSISTTGQFRVSAAAEVNATGTTYDYFVIGRES